MAISGPALKTKKGLWPCSLVHEKKREIGKMCPTPLSVHKQQAGRKKRVWPTAKKAKDSTEAALGLTSQIPMNKHCPLPANAIPNAVQTEHLVRRNIP